MKAYILIALLAFALAAEEEGCYKDVVAKINQRPVEGRKDYRISVEGNHRGDHMKEAQTIILVFNAPVHFVECWGAELIGENDSKKIALRVKYHQNPNDHLYVNPIVFTSEEENLEIMGAAIDDAELANVMVDEPLEHSLEEESLQRARAKMEEESLNGKGGYLCYCGYTFPNWVSYGLHTLGCWEYYHNTGHHGL